jgi:hypothetical protein
MRALSVSFIIVGFILISGSIFAQPIPVELMSGHRYTTFNLVVSKGFTTTSKFGFFHMNTLEVNYKDKSYNDFSMQDLLYFQPLKNIRITGGAFYGQYPGFIPTVGAQYLRNFKNLFILVAPRVNLQKDLEYDIFSIIQYKHPFTVKTKLYTRLQLLNLFGANGNIKSYQWVRLGLEIKGTQFGLAADFDEMGPDPKLEYNFGLFIRREIF